jgi:nicotinamide-nucleotide amidase
MFPDDLKQQATDLLAACKAKNIRVATAESCTGGMLAALFTEIPGCSSNFECGFITYSNDSKIQMLDVEAEIIKEHGAVSGQVAIAMAKGALKKSAADMTVAITGVAGPDGGTPQKPVGLVFIAVATESDTRVEFYYFEGNRHNIRMKSTEQALAMLKDTLSSSFVSVA